MAQLSTSDASLAPAREREPEIRSKQLQAAVSDAGSGICALGSLMLVDHKNDETCSQHRGQICLMLRRAAWRTFYGSIEGFNEAEERWAQVDRKEAFLITKKEREELERKSKETPNLPVENDPYLAKRQPGEPIFILYGRDSRAAEAIMRWIHQAEMEILMGARAGTTEEYQQIEEARKKVVEFRNWYTEHKQGT